MTSQEYWVVDALGEHGPRVRAEYDDDALDELKRRIKAGAIGPLEGVVNVVRSDGDTIMTWDGPAGLR